MQAFNNDSELKAGLLAEIEKHRLADQVVKNTYGNKDNGIFRGCTIDYFIKSYGLLTNQKLNTSDYAVFELFGIPRWLAFVNERICKGLPLELASLWPGQFLESIPLGVNLNQVKVPFLVFILKSTLKNFDHKKYPDVKKSIDTVIHLYESGETNLDKFIKAGRATACAAAYAANATANAAYAAYADATNAADAANAVANAVAADAVAADATVYADAKQKSYIRFADELLNLMRGCK